MLETSCFCINLLCDLLRCSPQFKALDAMFNPCTGKYSECLPIPQLQGGNSSCRLTQSTGVSVCDLECGGNKELTSSVDPSPQICIDGQWSYQRMKVPFPTCEGEQLPLELPHVQSAPVFIFYSMTFLVNHKLEHTHVKQCVHVWYIIHQLVLMHLCS